MTLFLTNGGIILGAFAAFAVVHSLLAGAKPKERLKSILEARFVEGWYRLAYNVFSVVGIIPVLLLLVLLPDGLLYQLESPWSIILRGLQVLGLIGLVGALFVTNVGQFAGLSQAIAYLNGDPLPLPVSPLQKVGMYRYVRHPLYFFSLLFVWANPTLSINGLWFNVSVTIYIVIGSLVEERRLLRIYGDVYREYRAHVSWLIPWFPAPPMETEK